MKPELHHYVYNEITKLYNKKCHETLKMITLSNMFNALNTGTNLKISETAKYLGIILDMRWTWNDHINNITRKAKWSLMTCRRLIGTSWGLKPQICDSN